MFTLIMSKIVFKVNGTLQKTFRVNPFFICRIQHNVKIQFATCLPIIHQYHLTCYVETYFCSTLPNLVASQTLPLLIANFIRCVEFNMMNVCDCVWVYVCCVHNSNQVNHYYCCIQSNHEWSVVKSQLSNSNWYISHLIHSSQ